MTTMLEKPDVTGPRDPDRRLVTMPELWGALAIASMWAAVLFVGIYGGDITSVDAGAQSTVVPSAVFVALFACIATVSVAKRAFRRDER